MKAKRLSKGERVSLDIITTLPQPIIETILCLLPIEEAARTSILSTAWRYKWTTIPKLVFFQSTVTKKTTKKKQTFDVASARKNMDTRCKLFYTIQQVLLLRQGPIHEFSLTMGADRTCSEIDQIILHLSRNHTVKKLTLDLFKMEADRLPLSVSIFSLHHLTKLHLRACRLNIRPIFNGLSSLTCLTLDQTWIYRETLLHLLSNCPSLKRLCLYIFDYDLLGIENASIMELFKCLPMIEHLTTWGLLFPAFVQASVTEEPPTFLIHLKYIFIEFMCFVDGYGLPCLADLIKCSPNLEKINMVIRGYDEGDEISPDKLEEHSLILEKYSDVWLEHLYELEIEEFRNYKPELEFVKFILTRSPNLKKVVLGICMTKDEELEMSKVLLRTPRASPVEIIVDNRYEEDN